MSSTCRIISSISYMSIFIAPFLVPVIIYLLIEDLEVREHARTAFSSHLIPVVALALLSIFFFESGQTFNHFTIISIILFGGISVIVTIWNIFKGIRLLQHK